MRIKTYTRQYFDKKEKLNFQIFLAKKGMMKSEYAEKLGCSPAYLSMVINGKKALSKKFAAKLKTNGFNYKKDYSNKR